MSRSSDVPEGMTQLYMGLTTRLTGYMFVLVGLAMASGGRERFVLPTYEPAQLLPGWPFSWGLLLVLAASGVLIGVARARARWIIVGLLAIGLWCAIFGLLALYAAVTNPVTPFHVGFVYLTSTVLVSARAMLYLKA